MAKWGVAIVSILMFGASLVFSTVCKSEEDLGSIGTLKKYCRETLKNKPDNLFLSGICLGKIGGFMSAYNMLQTDQELKVCAPDNVHMEQYVAIFVHWAERNPKMWNENFGYGLVLAFTEAFPCPKKK